MVNYDLPRSTADYTHRVGRTGRAGAEGVAVSFVTVDEIGHFELIEKRNGGIKLAREEVPGFEPKDYAKPSIGTKIPVQWNNRLIWKLEGLTTLTFPTRSRGRFHGCPGRPRRKARLTQRS